MNSTMRFAKLTIGVCLAGLVSCSGLGDVSGDFAAAAVRAEADAGCSIEIDGSSITELSVPMPRTELPREVARMVDAIQPGGTAVIVTRVWRSNGTAYRVVTQYPDDDTTNVRRTVLIDDEGQVVERSHEILESEVPGNIRDSVAELGRGTIQVIDVVQRGPGEEHYRFHLKLPDGRHFVARCQLDGTGLRVARVLPTELRAWS